MKGSILRRHTRAAVAATLASLLLLGGLAACSDSDGGSASSPSPTPSASASAGVPEPTSADVAALKAVTLAGALGSEPKLTFAQPFTVSAPVGRVETPGTGDALKDGQILTLNYVSVSGVDGSQQNTTYGATADHITLGDPSYVAALNTTLKNQKVGVRFLLAFPPVAPAAGATADPATAGATLMALEITAAKTIPTRAEGTAVVPPAGLPTVKLASDGKPTITPVKTAAPTTLVAQTLIKGAGPAVVSGQSVTFQYSGVLWDGTAFDSSWDKGTPFTTPIGTGQVIPGWDQGLVGQTVGSQVLLVVPPDLGYGAKASGSIPANSTLIFVVDILDAS